MSVFNLTPKTERCLSHHRAVGVVRVIEIVARRSRGVAKVGQSSVANANVRSGLRGA
jgi:hypothetical protein